MNHKAAALSLLIRLPTGDEDYTPPGVSGLCIGTALVTLGESLDLYKPKCLFSCLMTIETACVRACVHMYMCLHQEVSINVYISGVTVSCCQNRPNVALKN